MTLDTVVRGTRNPLSMEYIPYNKVPFAIGIDYAIVADSAKQDRDSYRVRHIIAGDLRKRPYKTMGRITEDRDIRLNPIDVERLYLAKAYEPLDPLLIKLRKSGMQFTAEDVARKYRLAGLKPLVYKGGYVSPPEISYLLLMRDEDIRRIGALAKPLIVQYGPLVTIETIKMLLKNHFNQREFKKKVGGEIICKNSGDRTYYSLFLVVKAYEHVTRKSG